MNFRAIQFADLRAQPAAGAPFIADIIPGDKLNQVAGTSEQNGWVNVNLFRIAGDPIPGWVLKSALEQAESQARDPLNIAGFVLNCIAIERQINRLDGTAPWFVSADFLIARALIETRLSNAGQLGVNDDGVGPLQVSSAEWKQFRDLFDTQAFRDETGFRPQDFRDETRDNPILQIWAAATRMYSDAKSMSLLRKADGIGSTDDPFIPSYLDLFHAYLVNSPAAALAVREAMNDTAKSAFPVAAILSPVLGDERLGKILKARGREGEDPGSVSTVVARTETALNRVLQEAAALIKTHAPEEVALVPGPQDAAQDPPWLSPARQELAAGVSNGTHRERIIGYFEHTDLRPRPTSIVAWCGAFAAHCMSNSGDAAAAASVPPRSALAASWKNWGVGIPVGGDIPKGAVVVLSPSPPTTGGSGHVAFFSRRDGNSVVLLGGNQSKRVKESKFPASLIAKICWLGELGTVDVGGTPTGTLTVGPLNDADWEKYCDVLGARESSNDYTKVNQFNYVGRWQFGAAALSEVGYVRPGKRNADLPSPNAWTGLNGVASMSDWRANKSAQDSAMLAFTRLYYKRLLRLGALTRDASRPTVGGMLAAAHLKGPGGALQFARGIVTADANGTTTKSYYAMMSRALGGTGLYPN